MQIAEQSKQEGDTTSESKKATAVLRAICFDCLFTRSFLEVSIDALSSSHIPCLYF